MDIFDVARENTIKDVSLITDETVRSCRNKKKDPIFCPVCSVTVRYSETSAHLILEMEKLRKGSSSKHKTNTKYNEPSTSVVNGNSEHNRDRETYETVRLNRYRRQRIKACKRVLEDITCPVCNKVTTENMNIHVEECLRKTNQIHSDTEDNIDVEGGYDEYEWAGQSRVRATSQLFGGVTILGTALSKTDEEEDLVVDDDDTNTYGLPQYSEQDVIISENDKEHEALRKAVIGINRNDCLKTNATRFGFDVNTKHFGDPIINVLKNRISELQNQCMEESNKCLICMERYKTPVTSTCCWHVYCEQCWLQTLGAKKLCPQCNTITSPTDLRRIYM